MKKIGLTILAFGLLVMLVLPGSAQRIMENLDRGVYAIYRGNYDVFISWRMLGTDPEDVAFNVYRVTNGTTTEKLNETPITDVTFYIDKIKDVTPKYYYVRPIIDGVEQEASAGFQLHERLQKYIAIPIQTPEGYTPNDAAVGDLNGDGKLDIVLKQEKSPYDNSQNGVCTGTTKLEGYTIDGEFLWRIDLGVNIREGAHYTPFIVYDLNNDGYAEVAVRTAEGTTDGEGNTIGDVNGDGKTNYVDASGRILSGPEFISIFDGQTGKEIARENYIPRGKVTDWGDNYGNRVDRFLMAVAYLDGVNPSLIMCRGYYHGRSPYKGKTVVTALDYNAGSLTERWSFTAIEGGVNSTYVGQGCHSLSIGDVDNDGKDEIIYGAMALDDDGTGLYSTNLGHGDASHLSDIDPNHEGLEFFMPHEHYPNPAGLEVRDADSGELLWGIPSNGDVGRGVTMDVDPNYPGYEVWGYGGGISGLYTCTGTRISDNAPSGCNFGIWWDGDLLREQLDGTIISKWNPATEGNDRLVTGYNEYSVGDNNGTKKNPCFCADILGDWREEIIWRSSDNQKLLIVCTTTETNYRMHTLLHDPIYRLSVAFQNVGYNQPTQPGFYFGDGMTMPAKPDIKVVERVMTSLESESTQNSMSSFRIYPNPVESVCYVTIENELGENVKVELLNHLGQKVFGEEYSTASFSVDMNDLPSGMYCMVLDQNGMKATAKILKK